jgi:hypothetical protein
MKHKEESKKPKSTPSFILELPLIVNSEQKRILLARFEAGRQLYNACLGEALKRYKLMIRSVAYRNTLKMPRSTEEERKIRSEGFDEIAKRYNFSDAAIQSYTKIIRKSWIAKHSDAVLAQKLASRAFNAVFKLITGEAEKVQFKRNGGLNSLEGKSNVAAIMWKNNRIEWNKLTLRAIINAKDEVVQHGLSSRVKYVRLVKKTIRGNPLFYAQLICEGIPFVKEKNEVKHGKIGIDIGPSTIAIVGDKNARLDLFCRELDDKQREIRKLQRKLDRQRRANNSNNYNTDGTIKKGCKLEWNNSHGYIETRTMLAELRRKQAEHRKSLQGKLANEIVRQGNEIYLEDISYKALQKNYGKSVGFRAPSSFVTKLEKKVIVSGGDVIKFSTQTTALSQVCQCGKREKKKLSKRWHKCECGVTSQRDIYSAFLARNVYQDSSDKWKLDYASAKSEWESIKPFLDTAVSQVKKKYFCKPIASLGL